MRYLLSEIAAIVSGRLYGEDRVVEGVITDSRSSNLGSNYLFMAMRGVNHDSHQYITEMITRGVSSFLVEDGDGLREDASYIVVENSLRALQILAMHHRRSFKGEVVAITGSNGKTVVKEWIAQLAPDSVKLFRSPRSYNSQLGVALSLLKIKSDDHLAIIEAGISKVGEMDRLFEMISPDMVVVTSIGAAHQEGFSSIHEKIHEKLKLAQNGGRLIYHSDYIELHDYILNRCEIADLQLIDASGVEGGKFDDVASRRNSQIITALFKELNFDRADFSKIQPLAMRLDVRKGINNSLIVNDSYNSDIDSLTIALDYLNSIRSSRSTTLILSPILQSGASAQELYGDVAKVIERAGVDKLIGVGSQLSEYSELFSCEKEFYATTEELLLKLNRDDFAGRALLLKGNRESRFERVMHSLESQSHTTVLEINLDTMLDNLNHYRATMKSRRIMAMIKAFGYGCGDYEVAQMLCSQGVDYLAVAFADEGVALREKGVTMPIVVLNADDGSYDQMLSYRLAPEIYSLRSLDGFIQRLLQHGEREYPIHIKLDSGMHRLGFSQGDIPQLLSKLNQYSDLVSVESIFTHLSSADMASEDIFTQGQIASFEQMSQSLIDGLGYAPLRHVAATSGIENYPSAHYDMTRLGIGLYGLGGGDVTPVATLKSRIVQIKHLAKGESVGYGRGAILEQDRVTATIPIGYADGLNRHLGCGAWNFLVSGRPAPIVGRVCMDSVMIDVTDIEGVQEGDEVVILSPEKGNTPADMAQVLGTIPYEIMTSISDRVKRIYIKE